MLRIRSAAVTRQGRTREINQDSVFHWSGKTEMGQGVGLGIVCDGLGGHAAGELASRLAVETVSADLTTALQSAGSLAVNDADGPNGEDLGEWVLGAIRKANSQIHRYAQSHREATDMGTTITLAAVFDRQALIANVGDSRTFHWRSPELTQVTHDHSFVAALVEQGLLQEKDEATHPKGNVILRAVGTDERVEIDLFPLQVEAGDKFLLCSDGLWKAFPERTELIRWLKPSLAPAEACRQIATESYRRSGTDDTSAVLITVA